MIIKKYPAPPIETAAERYDRDWLNVPDLDTDGFDDRRHDRTLLQQSTERKSRRYVDDGISAVVGNGDPLNVIYSEDFSGGSFGPEWSVAYPEGFSFSGEGVTLSEEVSDAHAYYMDGWRPGYDIFVDIKDQYFHHPEVGKVLRTGFNLSLQSPAEQKGVRINTFLIGYSGEYVGEQSLSVTPDPDGQSITESISTEKTLNGRHFLKFRDGKAQWWHNETLVAEIDHGELPESMNIALGFQYYAGIIERFGIVDSGSDNNGGESTDPEVPEGSFTETFNEKF